MVAGGHRLDRFFRVVGADRQHGVLALDPEADVDRAEVERGDCGVADLHLLDLQLVQAGDEVHRAEDGAGLGAGVGQDDGDLALRRFDALDLDGEDEAVLGQ